LHLECPVVVYLKGHHSMSTKNIKIDYVIQEIHYISYSTCLGHEKKK